MTLISKVLIVDDLHPEIVTRLKKFGVICDIDTISTPTEILEKLENYQGIVIRTRFRIDAKFIEKSGSLIFIARAGAGMENIDVRAAENAGIAIINSPEGNRDEVAEHALGMLLSLLNKICVANQEIRNGKWNRDKNWGTTLRNKTIGVIGYGYMGEAFCKRLSGFDVRILCYDKYKKGFGNIQVIESTLDDIFQEADILSLHIPLTAETRNLVDHTFIDNFRNPFYLINTSRGGNVNTENVVSAIKSGKILGACLDVLEYESMNFENMFGNNSPEPLKYLLKSEKVILTPHVAGWTNESYYKHSVVLADKIVEKFFDRVD